MDAVTPTPIKLEDLTRDELLEVLARAMPFVRQRDLYRARWEVACRKSDAAGAAAIAASEKSAAASAAWAKVKNGNTVAGRRAQNAYFRAREECVTASRAADRAYAAQERAYRALEACKS
jgi:hypothetical protein